MKYLHYLFYALFTLSLFLIGLVTIIFLKPAQAIAQEVSCVTNPITISGVEKKLLPLPADCQRLTGFSYCGRGKQDDGDYAPSPACVTPKKNHYAHHLHHQN